MCPSGQANCGAGTCPPEVPVASAGEGHCLLRLQHHLRRTAGQNVHWLWGPSWRPLVDPLHCPHSERENAGDRPCRDDHDLHHILWLWLPEPPQMDGPGKGSVPVHKGRIWKRSVDTQRCACHTECILNSLGTGDIPACLCHQSSSNQNINCPSQCEYLKLSWTVDQYFSFYLIFLFVWSFLSMRNFITLKNINMVIWTKIPI